MESHLLKWKNKRAELLQFFSSTFSKECIELHEKEGVDFERVQRACPSLPRGWFELAMLSTHDRKEFLAAFWKNCLYYDPQIPPFIDRFFASLEEIGVYLCKEIGSGFFEPLIVYMTKEGSFYLGYLPLEEEKVSEVKNLFEGMIDQNFLKFMKIHNGFYAPHLGRILSFSQMQENLQTLKNSYLEKNGVVDEILPFFEKQDLSTLECLELIEEEHEVVSFDLKEKKVFLSAVCFTWIEWFFVFCGEGLCTTRKW